MGDPSILSCACGQLRLAVKGQPIISVECCCTSCRSAAERMMTLAPAPPVLTERGTTPFVMYRKDRLHIQSGADTLAAFRLLPGADTKRVIATCCNTPVYLEFKGGHWLSLYGGLWPGGRMPPAQMRTMTSDLPPGAVLPDDIPNAGKQSLGFFVKLLGAWISMGFRNPKMPPTREFNV